MRKTYFALFALLLALGSCKKGSDTSIVAEKYMSISSGSTWQFSLVNNSTATTTNYTVTSTNRDSTISGRSYHVFTNSNTGVNEYYFISGNDYYTFRTLGLALGNARVETIYLKDNSGVGATWTKTITLTVPGVPIPVPVTFSYAIVGKDLSRTVNGIAYTGVIHVSTAISSSLIPSASLTTDIHGYYAPKVGMIESTNKVNLNYLGFIQTTDTKTTLLSSDIK